MIICDDKGLLDISKGKKLVLGIKKRVRVGEEVGWGWWGVKRPLINVKTLF